VTLPLSYSRLLLPTAAPIRKIRSQRKTSNHRQRHRAGRPHCRIIQRPPCRNSQHNEQSHGEKETVHARSLLIVTNPKPQQWCTGEDSNLRSSQGAADLQSAAINHSATCAKLCRTLRVQSLRPNKQKLSGAQQRSALAPWKIPCHSCSKIAVRVGRDSEFPYR
jgi:hypothetical protein